MDIIFPQHKEAIQQIFGGLDYTEKNDNRKVEKIRVLCTRTINL